MEKELDILVAEIDQVREEMEKIVSRTDPTLEICPGWTVKEVIGHITAWEIVIHKAIQAFLAGDPPYFLHEQDFDIRIKDMHFIGQITTVHFGHNNIGDEQMNLSGVIIDHA